VDNLKKKKEKKKKMEMHYDVHKWEHHGEHQIMSFMWSSSLSGATLCLSRIVDNMIEKFFGIEKDVVLNPNY